MLGSKDAIAHEKKEIFSYFDENDVGFVPDKDEYTAFLKETAHGKIFTYSADPASYTLEGLSGTEIRYKGQTIHLPLPGIHNVQNAFAAITVAEYCNIPMQSIKTGIEQMQALFGRSQIIRGSVTYLLDCYNANPDSMHAGLALCANIAVRGKKVYVLASMKELGSESIEAHQGVCAAAFASDADALFFFGEEMCTAAAEQGKHSSKMFFCFKEAEANKLRDTLDGLLNRNDFVFLKGSRSLELEQFEPILQKERV
jgi:UDP-N-acetylmuramoyl-tripeptide--D-alanyl-D-alanine ligase